ncbi:MAG: hypothetical protein P8Q26_02925 [Ascidiaceihabitans sp.]|nr:hypothetical protein [Ascidiaceihabitans sp.]
MRLILHMGVQKTGTTSLQHFLRRNKDALASRMLVMVPNAKSVCRLVGRAAWDYSQGIVDKAELITAIETARDTMQASDHDLCLLSHENLCGAMPGTGDLLDLYPHLPEIMGLLDTHLAPLIPEYVFYTRDIQRWKSSVHNQVVKSNNYTHALERFRADTNALTDWDDLKLRLNAAVGADRITWIALEDETDRARPGQQLLKIAGLTDADIAALDPIPGDRNESLTPGALEFMRLANTLQLPRNLRRELAKSVVQNQPVFDSLTDVLVQSRKEH